MIDYATEFWFGNVEPKLEPPVTERDTELLNKIYANSDPSKTVESEDYLSVETLIWTKEQLTKAKSEHEFAANQIKDQMKNAETLMFQGQVVATWKSDKNGKRTFKVK
jgi:hypothetical protein